jgi:hypothetical protein
MTKQKEIGGKWCQWSLFSKPIYTTWPVMGVENPNPVGGPFVNQICANLVWLFVPSFSLICLLLNGFEKQSNVRHTHIKLGTFPIFSSLASQNFLQELQTDLVWVQKYDLILSHIVHFATNCCTIVCTPHHQYCPYYCYGYNTFQNAPIFMCMAHQLFTLV